MPFVLDQRPFYKWKVDINVVVDGKESTESFIALFKNVTQSRFKEMIKMVEYNIHFHHIHLRRKQPWFLNELLEVFLFVFLGCFGVDLPEISNAGWQA